MQLAGKVCLITGSGNGIGQGIAQRFAQEGAAVGVLDIDAQATHHTTDAIVQAGGKAVALPADVASGEAVQQAVRTLTERFGLPTVLIHNAAIMPIATIDRTTEEEWDRVFAVNVKGAYWTSHAVIPLMREAGGGSIIFTTSASGMIGMGEMVAYSATKGALNTMVRAMAVDHSWEGIRVNTIAPGTISAPMFNRSIETIPDTEKVRSVVAAHNPLKRLGRIDEVVNAFVFLASDQSSFVTGANYAVDGGLSIQCAEPDFVDLRG